MKKDKPNDIKRELTVGEVAERSGLAVSTLHFYEAKGSSAAIAAGAISGATRVPC